MTQICHSCTDCFQSNAGLII